MKRALLPALLFASTIALGAWLYSSSYALSDERIADERIRAGHDPFMGLAGTSPKKLREAVAELRETQERLAEAQTDERAAQLVREALYPIHFLEALATLEEKRLAFVANGTADEWVAYQAAVDDAYHAYRTDIGRFRAAFLEAVPEDAPAYVTGTARVTRRAVLESLDSLENGMEERYACVSELCEAASHSIDLTRPTITPGERARAKTIAYIFTEARPGMSLQMFDMRKGACSATLPGGGIFGLQQIRPDFAVPLYFGDLRLVESKEHADLPFYAHFVERGVAYVPSYTLVPYMCPEFGDEYARLLGLRALLNAESETDVLALQLRNNSTDFDQMVRYVAFAGEVLPESHAHDAPGPLDAMTLFFTRSAFLALFLAHNPSATGTHEAFFEPSNVPLDEQPFVFYGTLKKTSTLVPQLIQSLKASDEVHGITS